MKELSEFLLINKNLKTLNRLKFEVKTSVNLSDLNILNCIFYLFPSANLTVFNGNIDNVQFISKLEGHEINDDGPGLKFIDCNEFDRNSLYGNFKEINLQSVKINIFNDFSRSVYFTFIDSEINNFIIKGVADNVHLKNSYFLSNKLIPDIKIRESYKSSIWNKKINISAVCDDTIFHNSQVQPFYLATKCKDKSSLDLTSAILIDDWSRLRKKYSGLSLFIVFFLSFSFFLPMITQSFFLLLSTKVSSELIVINKSPLWEVLLFGGKDGILAVGYAALTILLVVYNILRIYMTISIAQLREEERFLSDSNFKLVSIHPDKFETQLAIDKILKVLFWISFVYAIIKLKDALLISVPNL